MFYSQGIEQGTALLLFSQNCHQQEILASSGHTTVQKPQSSRSKSQGPSCANGSLLVQKSCWLSQKGLPGTVPTANVSSAVFLIISMKENQRAERELLFFSFQSSRKQACCVGHFMAISLCLFWNSYKGAWLLQVLYLGPFWNNICLQPGREIPFLQI